MDKANATVLSMTYLTETLFVLRVRPDFPIPDFVSGQYVAIGLSVPGSDRICKRAYSICSAPANKDILEFYVARVDEGVLTPMLWNLRAGARLFVSSKIVGKFTLAGALRAKRIIWVATGTGIAPFISMMRSTSTWEVPRPILLFYGARHEPDLGYHAELLQLVERHPTFEYTPILSRPADGWEGKTGYVQHHLVSMSTPLHHERDHVFLCGNPNMIDEVERLLVEKGFHHNSKRQAGNLHFEKFW